MPYDIEDLYDEMRSDSAFEHLRRGRNPLVPGEGRIPAGVMVIGEAPGADEVMALRPFVGASGRVLRQLMATAGLTTGSNGFKPNCWLTNAVKFRPPRNRTPTFDEIKASRNYLLREWRLLGKPSVVVAVGAVALTAVQGVPMSIGKYAGECIKSNGRTLWPMFHPAYGLRGDDSLRQRIESHWEALAEWLDENNSR